MRGSDVDREREWAAGGRLWPFSLVGRLLFGRLVEKVGMVHRITWPDTAADGP